MVREFLALCNAKGENQPVSSLLVFHLEHEQVFHELIMPKSPNARLFRSEHCHYS